MPQELQTLKPSHRLLAYLVASGYTNKQCSAALAEHGTPFHPQYIGQIKQNAEFKKLVLEIQREHMGGTVRSVLARLAQEAIPSLKKMASLRDYAEDEGVQGRMADRLFTSFEKASGLGGRKEEDRGPLVQVNLTSDEHSTFVKAISESREERSEAVEAEFTEAEPKAPPKVRSTPRAKTVKELVAELGPCEKYVESAAV